MCVAMDQKRYLASEPQFERKTSKYLQNLHPNLKTINKYKKIHNKKIWGSGLDKTLQGPFIELSQPVGQWLRGHQYGALRIRYIISLCIFSVTLISP